VRRSLHAFIRPRALQLEDPLSALRFGMSVLAWKTFVGPLHSPAVIAASAAAASVRGGASGLCCGPAALLRWPTTCFLPSAAGLLLMELTIRWLSLPASLTWRQVELAVVQHRGGSVRGCPTSGCSVLGCLGVPWGGIKRDWYVGLGTGCSHMACKQRRRHRLRRVLSAPCILVIDTVGTWRQICQDL
jgi:hypothetical protein